MKKNIFVKGLQFIFFMPPFEPDNKVAFANDFMIKTDNVFTHEPQIIPIPKQAPPEVSRIILKNSEQTMQTHFALNRVAFIYQDVQNTNPDIDAIYPGLRFQLSKIGAAIKEMTNLPFLRFGFVTNLLLEFPEGVNQIFSENYFTGNPFPNAREIQLNVHHVFKIDNYLTNRWVKYKTLRKIDKPNEDTGLGIEIDLNTLADKNLNATPSEALNFFMAGKNHIQKELNSFPFINFEDKASE